MCIYDNTYQEKGLKITKKEDQYLNTANLKMQKLHWKDFNYDRRVFLEQQ